MGGANQRLQRICCTLRVPQTRGALSFAGETETAITTSLR